MAFSFAAADLLVETDATGVITFALGAASAFGEADADALIGRDVSTLFTRGDQKLVAHIAASMRPGRRLGPIPARPRDARRSAVINACTLPGAAQRRFFTIAFAAPTAPPAAEAARDEDTGLVTPKDFAAVATDTVKQLKASGREVKLTLLTIEGQEDLLDKLDSARGEAFLERVGVILRSASAGDAASQMTKGRYGLVHDEMTEPDLVKNDIAAAAHEIAPEGAGVSVRGQTLCVEDHLSEEDAARALVYTVNAYATDSPAALSIDTMGAAMNEMLRETSARIVEFKRAIAEKRVGFVVQPVVALKTREISHYEMLVRFEPGQSPFGMVTFAEQTGIIAELDMSVLEVAAAFLSRSAPRDFPGLAVNVSGLSMVNPIFVTRLLERLLNPGFAREKLLFEITESAEINDLASADEAIKRIRKLGHHVCLDDFGAGAASFPYLRALDVDGVKIDGAYVCKAVDNRRDALLLKAMTGLCHDLGVTTIAEMVENEDHVDHLAKLGVDKGQGFLFGRPVPLARFIETSAA